MTLSLVQELIILLSAGLFAALVCRKLNISILIGYLVVGTLLGDGALGLVTDQDHELAHFAELGVFLLLFTIGLEFSIEDLKRLGRHFVIGGGVQMLLVAVPVSMVLCGTGMAWQPAFLIAGAVAFSSTVLVFRTLTEYGQAQQPPGRRAIGILLFQDAALIPFLLLVPLLTGSGANASLGDLLLLGASSLGFIAAVIGLRTLLGKWVIPAFANFRSAELIVLFTMVSLSCVTLAAYQLGLPPAIGAFAAGLIFNGNRWSHQIDALVLPFRETFAAIFFVGLGLIFNPMLLITEPALILLILPLLIILKSSAATIALKLTGLNWKSSLGMGIGLAHVGEFAFVLVLLGVDSGVLREIDYQRVVGIAVCSLILTPTLLKFGLKLTQSDSVEEQPASTPHYDDSGKKEAIIIGAGPIGRSIASQLEIQGNDVCLVDLSPINLHSFAQEGFRTVSGDATDESVLERAGVKNAGTIVVCVPNDSIALVVVRVVRQMNPAAIVLVRCRYQANLGKLKTEGATQVVAEESEAALAMMRLLNQVRN